MSAASEISILKSASADCPTPLVTAKRGGAGSVAPTPRSSPRRRRRRTAPRTGRDAHDSPTMMDLAALDAAVDLLYGPSLSSTFALSEGPS